MTQSNHPIIVCGPPRCATTMVLQLLGSHHRISATREICSHIAEPLMDYIIRCKKKSLQGNKNNKNFRKKRLLKNENRYYKNLIVEMWWSSTDSSVRRERVVHKTPRSEDYFDFYNDIFDGETKFIYCLRHPKTAIASLKNLRFRKGKTNFNIESVINMYKNSVKKYIEIKTKQPHSVHLVQIDKIAPTETGMLEFGNEIMNFIGEEMDEQVRQTLIRNEVVNVKRKKHELTEDELETINNDTELAEFKKIFGYNL